MNAYSQEDIIKRNSKMPVKNLVNAKTVRDYNEFRLQKSK